MNQDKTLEAFKFAEDKIKKIDYPFYLIFKDHAFVSEIFTIYCFHLELANIPVVGTSEETRLIRYKWWLDTLENINNLNNKLSHPIISLIVKNFVNNQKVIKAFKDLIVIRSKENELHGFKTENQLKKYVNNTNNVIWQLIYQMLNQCEITNEKSKTLSNFSLGIKYMNISASLYYRDYNNHFFISEETAENFKNISAKNRQYEIFKYNINSSLTLLNLSIRNLKPYKDLKSFYIYARINKSHLLLVEKGYNKTDMSTPPTVSRLSTFLKMKLLK